MKKTFEIGIAVLTFAALGTAGAATNIHEIVVTATRIAQDSATIPAAVEVIDRQTIEASGAANLGDALQSAAGIDIQGGAFPGTSAKLNLRGMTTGYQSERVLVLVDGRRANDAYVGNTELTLLALDNVERIEVVRGPASALYGSNAEGGVINIITRRGTTNQYSRVKVEAGSYSTYKGQASHGWQVGPLDYFVSVGDYETAGYTTNSDGSDRDWKASNLSGNFGYAISSNAEIRLRTGYSKGEGDDENSSRFVQKDYQDLSFTRTWKGAHESELALRAYHNGEYDNYQWKYGAEGLYRLLTFGANAQQSFRAGDDHQLTMGLEALNDRVDIAESRNTIAEDSSTYGAFIQDEFQAADWLQLTAGVRNDYNPDYENMISPRISALVKFNEDAEWYASFNQAHRAPSLSDRFVKVQYNSMVFQGNPDLSPEVLTAYETGVRFRAYEKVSVSCAFFYNDINDAIDYLYAGAGTFKNQNVNNETSYGLESSLKWQVTECLSLFANYTRTEGTYKEYPSDSEVEGNRLAYLARNKAGFGTTFKRKNGFSTTLEGRYVGPRFADSDNSAANLMESYLVVDWNVKIPVAKNIALTCEVDNLFNEHYQSYLTTWQPGITVMSGVEITL